MSLVVKLITNIIQKLKTNVLRYEMQLKIIFKNDDFLNYEYF